MVFIDKWSLFGGYIVLFIQRRLTDVWPLFTEWSLFGGYIVYLSKEWLLKCVFYLQSSHYSEVAFDTGLAVYYYAHIS